MHLGNLGIHLKGVKVGKRIEGEGSKSGPRGQTTNVSCLENNPG